MKTANRGGRPKKPVRATKAAKNRAARVASFGQTLAATPVRVTPESSGLTAADLNYFRDVLLQKRAELLGDVNTLRAEALNKNRQDAAGDLSSMPLHMADLGTDHYEQEFTLGLMESERQLLVEIDDALARIRDGTYGVCAATGRAIGKARLKAVPWSKYCLDVSLAQERGRQRRF